jgi:pimeloyl-ACP methyl ester carboxylesterase
MSGCFSAARTAWALCNSLRRNQQCCLAVARGARLSGGQSIGRGGRRGLVVARGGSPAQNWIVTRRRLAVLLASAFAAGCGGGSGPTAAHVRTPPPPQVVGLPGKLVSIGGGRSLFLHCVGRGSPAVVLAAGLKSDTSSWRNVQPQLGGITQTCAYDRAGDGNSVAPPGSVSSGRTELADLAALLYRAGIAPPWVIVGHSYGGLLARLFVQAHRDQTAGIVLVDAMGRNQTRRLLALWPKSEEPAERREQATPVRDGVDVAATEALAARVTTLGNTRLAVITAGRENAVVRQMTRRVARAIDRNWTAMQDELAALSSDRVHVVALRSEHSVQHGQPLVVIQAVKAVVDAARASASLPPCPRVFSGPGTRCVG